VSREPKPQREPKPPRARAETDRQALRAALGHAPISAKELSAVVGVSERDVAEHLEHLQRSLPAAGEKLVVEAPRCLGCGFEFSDRKRFGRPSRCPECRSERITPPKFSVG
jgi:predicted Zn-ribbon and HTH transcriptional regulator